MRLILLEEEKIINSYPSQKIISKSLKGYLPDEKIPQM